MVDVSVNCVFYLSLVSYLKHNLRLLGSTWIERSPFRLRWLRNRGERKHYESELPEQLQPRRELRLARHRRRRVPDHGKGPFTLKARSHVTILSECDCIFLMGCVDVYETVHMVWLQYHSNGFHTYSVRLRFQNIYTENCICTHHTMWTISQNRITFRKNRTVWTNLKSCDHASDSALIENNGVT